MIKPQDINLKELEFETEECDNCDGPAPDLWKIPARFLRRRCSVCEQCRGTGVIGTSKGYDIAKFLSDKLNRIEKEIDKYILEGIEISKQNHRNNEGLRKAKEIIRREFIWNSMKKLNQREIDFVDVEEPEEWQFIKYKGCEKYYFDLLCNLIDEQNLIKIKLENK